MSKLVEMLRTSAAADKAKALLTLELLQVRPVGIGDHSTVDFYRNAEEALSMLVDADDRLAAIDKYFVPAPPQPESEPTVKKSKGQLNG
jgi:hypothetical protein